MDADQLRRPQDGWQGDKSTTVVQPKRHSGLMCQRFQRVRRREIKREDDAVDHRREEQARYVLLLYTHKTLDELRTDIELITR